MSYEDTFGKRYDRTDEASEPTITPLDDLRGTEEDDGLASVEAEQGPGDAALLNFDGFVGRHPLLVERPTMYRRRLNDAMRSLIVPPDDDRHGGYEGRVLFHPAVSTPFPVLFGDEMLTSQDAAGYPLLHAPANHPLDPGETNPVLYALALQALYTAGNFMWEDGTGDLLAYPVGDPFTIEDDLWDDCIQWAGSIIDDLTALNLARLLGFAMQDPEHEADTLNLLFQAWGVMDGTDALIDAGRQAAEHMGDAYEQYTELALAPFDEE